MERLRLRPRQLTPAEAVGMNRKVSDRLRVIDPMTGRPLPEKGQSVVPSSDWVRRLRDGDVEHVKPASRIRPKSRSASDKE